MKTEKEILEKINQLKKVRNIVTETLLAGITVKYSTAYVQAARGTFDAQIAALRWVLGHNIA